MGGGVKKGAEDNVTERRSLIDIIILNFELTLLLAVAQNNNKPLKSVNTTYCRDEAIATSGEEERFSLSPLSPKDSPFQLCRLLTRC